MTTQTFTIGKAAKRSGLSRKLIRYYEAIGLIPPARRSASGPHSRGYRLFTSEDIGRLEIVAKARSLGFPLTDVAELLQCVEEECCSAAVPKFRQLLSERLRELDEKEAALRTLRAELKRLSAVADARAHEPLGQCLPGTSACTCAFGAPVEFSFKGRRAAS